MTRPPIISFKDVCKRFGDVTAVDAVSLDIAEGEFFALLGPSGCGKTTLLRMLAGFEVPSEGKILIDGRDVSTVPPNRRAVNIVFQSYAVFPHMSVAENVGYGLRMEGVGRSERSTRVAEALDLVQLGNLGERRPAALSGGQRQRVALARALVKQPRVLLLDEPLSALDAKLREAMRFELTRLQQKVGITFIMVTHDQDEALAMADRIAVMDGGRIAQLGTPAQLYESPTSRFVADFIGSVNILEGMLSHRAENCATVTVSELTMPIHLDRDVSQSLAAMVTIGLRPEKIELVKRANDGLPPKMEDAPERHNVEPGVIRTISYLGSESVFDIELPSGRRMRASRPNLTRFDQDDFGWDEPVWLCWHACSPVILST